MALNRFTYKGKAQRGRIPSVGTKPKTWTGGGSIKVKGPTLWSKRNPLTDEKKASDIAAVERQLEVARARDQGC